jgi:ABC-type uncharacterized transport system substrate-binding protein
LHRRVAQRLPEDAVCPNIVGVALGKELMRRREFITLVGSAAAMWPLAARTQQVTPVVGLLNAGSPGPSKQSVAAFRDGLKELGSIEGQNVVIDYRFAEGRFDRFPALAADLVRRPVNVVFVSSNPGVLAAKQATTTIPIVFSIGHRSACVGPCSKPQWARWQPHRSLSIRPNCPASIFLL